MNRRLAIKGIEDIIKGIRLVKKKYKTEFEERAAKSFISFMKTILISISILFVCEVICIISMLGYMDSGYVERNGTVVGDSVRYVQNVHQFVSLSELGIESSSVKEGSKIILYFDIKDNLVGGKVDDGSDEQKAIMWLVALLVSAIIFIITVIPLTKKVGLDWVEWLRFN